MRKRFESFVYSDTPDSGDSGQLERVLRPWVEARDHGLTEVETLEVGRTWFRGKRDMASRTHRIALCRNVIFTESVHLLTESGILLMLDLDILLMPLDSMLGHAVDTVTSSKGDAADSSGRKRRWHVLTAQLSLQ